MRELIAEEEAAKAQTNRVRRQSAAIERWRHASPGDGNGAFLRLGHDLDRTGMSRRDRCDTMARSWLWAAPVRATGSDQIHHAVTAGSSCRMAA